MSSGRLPQSPGSYRLNWQDGQFNRQLPGSCRQLPGSCRSASVGICRLLPWSKEIFVLSAALLYKVSPTVDHPQQSDGAKGVVQGCEDEGADRRARELPFPTLVGLLGVA